VKVPLPQAQNARVLADWVTTSLREAILNGYFEPGEKLDQDQIAEELKVSRTPVREALSRLEAEGFIEVRPHRGAYMAVVSQRDVCEVYEIRRLLEAEAVRQATPLIPESVLDELDRSLTETQTRFDCGDTSQHFASDIHFHKTILDFAPTRLLKDVLDSLNNRISMVRRFAQSRPGPHLVESLQEHRAILQAIRQRDPERAAELMKLHLKNSSQRIQELAQEPMGV
jgi:DNA-binding GntR family transcriptional regulator